MGWAADGNDNANDIERLLWNNNTIYDLYNTCCLLGLKIGPVGIQEQTQMEVTFDGYIFDIAEKKGEPVIPKLREEWESAVSWTIKMTKEAPHNWGTLRDCMALYRAQYLLVDAVKEALVAAEKADVTTPEARLKMAMDETARAVACFRRALYYTRRENSACQTMSVLGKAEIQQAQADLAMAERLLAKRTQKWQVEKKAANARRLYRKLRVESMTDRTWNSIQAHIQRIARVRHN
jgi:hypothetical protein